MNISVILEEIYYNLNEDSEYEILEMLKIIPEGSATGTEGVMRIGKFLVDLEVLNKPVYDKIKGLIEKYVLECNKNGIYYPKQGD